MAIDPNIALQFKTPQVDFGANYQRGAETANIQAATPGITADSLVKSRSAAADVWAGAHGQDFMEPDAIDPSKQVVNMAKLNRGLISVGLTDQGPRIANAFTGALQNQTTQAKSQTELNAALIKGGNESAQITAQQIEQMKKKGATPIEINNYYHTAREALDKKQPGMINDSNMPATYTDGWETKTAAGSMTEKEKLDQINTVRAQNIAQQGVDNAVVQTKMTGGQIVANAEVEAGKSRVYQAGASSLQDLMKDKNALERIASVGWDRFLADNPQYAPAAQSVAVYNQEKGLIGPAAMKPTDGGAFTVIDGLSKTHAHQAVALVNAATPAIGKKAALQPVAPTPVSERTAPKTSAGGIDMINKAGVILHGVTPDHKASAIAAGYTPK